jgi:WD40 repeat protein/serine/threonine protein kinase
MSDPRPADTRSANKPTGTPGPSWPALTLLRADQRERWQRGQRFLVESYLERQPPLANDTEAVLDLIYNEVILRQELGEPLQLEEYQKRFPQLAGQLKDLFDVHQALEESGPGGSSLTDLLDPNPAPRLSGSATMPADATLITPAGTVPGGEGQALPAVPGYEVLGKLGSGTFGVVYKARHLGLKRIIALKMIREGAHAPAEELARIRMEAESVARLQHPNVVQIHEIGEHAGLPYLALEYVEGGSLAQHLRGTPLPARQAAELVQTLARAMHVAHQANLVHRDLKPGNVLLAPIAKSEIRNKSDTRNPKSETNLIPEIRNPKQASITEKEIQKPSSAPVLDLGDSNFGIVSDFGFRASDFVPKVTDFGLAKQLDKTSSQTRSGAIMGTPSYMAPEQAMGKASAIGPAADTYALGAILYELLAGRPPFRAETALDTVMQVIAEDPVPPRRLQPKVPRELETICLKCLEKEPRKRYASALALAEDLRRFLGNEPILARPISWWGRGIKWARRRPAWASLIALAVAAVLTVGIMGFLHNRELTASLERAEAGELKARRNLYVADLNRAQRALDDGLVARAVELLDGQRPKETGGIDLRGFEWYYLKRLCDSARYTLPGRDAVAYSPDGKYLAIGGKDHTVLILDTAKRRVKHTLTGHKRDVTGIAYSADGNYIAAAGRDGSVRVWNARTGAAWIQFFGHTGAVWSVAFAPDQPLLASAGADCIVKFWDVARRRPAGQLATGLKKFILQVAFSPNREDPSRPLAVAGAGGIVEIWNTKSRQHVRTLPQHHNNAVAGVSFSPDAEMLATAGYDGTVRVWDAADGTELHVLAGHRGGASCVAFSPVALARTQPLATAGWDRIIRIWDALSGKLLYTFCGHRDIIVGLAFHPDGKQLTSVSADGETKIWDVSHDPGFRMLSARNQGLTTCVAFSPNGERLAAGTLVWQKQGQEKLIHGARVYVWDAASGSLLRALERQGGVIHCVAFSPDCRRLASGGSDETVKVWDAETGRLLAQHPEHTGTVNGLAFSPDGQYLASASSDKTVRLWDANTGRELHILQGHSAAVTGVASAARSPLLASGSADKTVKVWDAETGTEVHTLTDHTGPVNAVAFSADGRRLASASQDKTVILWDVPSWEKRHTLRGHTGPVSAVAFSQDGRRLVSLGKDQIVKVWDLATGQETLSLRVRDMQARGLAFSSNGWHIAVAGGQLKQGEVRIWDAIPDPE